MNQGGYVSNVHAGANPYFSANNRPFAPTRLALDGDLPPPFAAAVGVSGQSGNQREESGRSDGRDNSIFPITRNVSPPPVNVHITPNVHIVMPQGENVPTSHYGNHASGRILPSLVTTPSNNHGHSMANFLDGHNNLYFTESQIRDRTGSVLMYVRKDVHLEELILSELTGKTVARCQFGGRTTTITNCISNEIAGYVKQASISGNEVMSGWNGSQQQVFQAEKAGTNAVFVSNGYPLGTFGEMPFIVECTGSPEKVFGLYITSPSMDQSTKLLMLFASYLFFQKLGKGCCSNSPLCNCRGPWTEFQIAALICLLFVLVMAAFVIAFRKSSL